MLAGEQLVTSAAELEMLKQLKQFIQKFHGITFTTETARRMSRNYSDVVQYVQEKTIQSARAVRFITFSRERLNRRSRTYCTRGKTTFSCHPNCYYK